MFPLFLVVVVTSALIVDAIGGGASIVGIPLFVSFPTSSNP